MRCQYPSTFILHCIFHICLVLSLYEGYVFVVICLLEGVVEGLFTVRTMLVESGKGGLYAEGNQVWIASEHCGALHAQ